MAIQAPSDSWRAFSEGRKEHAMTTTRNRAHPLAGHWLPKRLGNLAICPAFKSGWTYLSCHQPAQNFQEQTYLILLHCFQIWLSLANKCQRTWRCGEAASQHNSKPSYSFLRGSHQDIWNQLLALLFITWGLFIWIYKVQRDLEKEDAVKVISRFISLFLFKTEHTETSQAAKAPFMSLNFQTPVQNSVQQLHPPWGDLGSHDFFPSLGEAPLRPDSSLGGWGRSGYSEYIASFLLLQKI